MIVSFFVPCVFQDDAIVIKNWSIVVGYKWYIRYFGA